MTTFSKPALTESPSCPNCGSLLPADSPAGLCPSCLIRAGFESRLVWVRGPASTAPCQSSGFEPPDVKVLADRLPELEILGLIGKGGMGAVYKARQRQLDRIVAVKILPSEISHDPALAERFAREARALAKLNHPHIVAVYDFGQVRSDPIHQVSNVEQAADSMKAVTTNGLWYFVMEFVAGTNLRQVIQRGDVKPDEALAIISQICDALQYAHEQGVVHRDIKPENILIDTRGRVKIADFGLAKLTETGGRESRGSSLTASNLVMGTMNYMAPEQLEGSHHVDHRADIYSLGVVFYELLTRELPIGRFAPPSKKVAIDVRLDEVVLRTLEKEPEQRYQHASDVKTAIEQTSIVSQVPPSLPAAPLSAADLSPRWTFTLIAGVAGGLTIAAGVALTVFAFVTTSPASGDFWGWMGGAIGCFFGGGSALAGAVSSYRSMNAQRSSNQPASSRESNK